MENEIYNNEKACRLEIDVDGKYAYVEYLLTPDCIALTHTFVPRELRGRKFAERLVEAAIEMGKKKKLKLNPVCPYVQAYILRHKPDIEVVSVNTASSCAL